MAVACAGVRGCGSEPYYGRAPADGPRAAPASPLLHVMHAVRTGYVVSIRLESGPATRCCGNRERS